VAASGGTVIDAVRRCRARRAQPCIPFRVTTCRPSDHRSPSVGAGAPTPRGV